MLQRRNICFFALAVVMEPLESRVCLEKDSAAIEKRFLDELKKNTFEPEQSVSVDKARLSRTMFDIVEDLRAAESEIYDKFSRGPVSNAFYRLVYHLLDHVGISSPAKRLGNFECALYEESERLGKEIKASQEYLEELFEEKKKLCEDRRCTVNFYVIHKRLEENLRASGAPAKEIEEAACEKIAYAGLFSRYNSQIHDLNVKKYVGVKVHELFEYAKNRLDLKINAVRGLTGWLSGSYRSCPMREIKSSDEALKEINDVIKRYDLQPVLQLAPQRTDK